MSEPPTSPDDLRRIAAEMIDGLRASGAVPGIDIGEQAPRFTLPNAVGKSISLDERLEQGPVVVVFYRGAWCPYCNVHLRGIQERLPELRDQGATLVAISPQAPDSSLAFTERLTLGFDLLSDLDQSVSSAWRLRFELPHALRQVYRDMGMALDEQNADGTWHLPVPATFVLDSSGVVRARHVEPDYRERMPVSGILDALKDLAPSVP
jgi:peroxiredoxin